MLTQSNKNTKFIYGGGNNEVNIYKRINDFAARESGKKTLAIEGYVNVIKQLLMIVCENASLDAVLQFKNNFSEIIKPINYFQFHINRFFTTSQIHMQQYKSTFSSTNPHSAVQIHIQQYNCVSKIAFV